MHCTCSAAGKGGPCLEKAVNHARNHRETLQGYMLDGRCELSDNAAERRAKSYAIGRKDSLFHASAAGAEASALVYSMIESAKANQTNVFQYLYILLLYMPDHCVFLPNFVGQCLIYVVSNYPGIDIVDSIKNGCADYIRKQFTENFRYSTKNT